MTHWVPIIPLNSIKYYLNAWAGLWCWNACKRHLRSSFGAHTQVFAVKQMKKGLEYLWYERKSNWVKQLIINIKSDRECHTTHILIDCICLCWILLSWKKKKSFPSLLWLHTAFKAGYLTVHARLLVTWCGHSPVSSEPSSSTSTICRNKIVR